MDLLIYNRQKKEVETEHIVGKKYLQWLYYKSSGNFILEKIVKRKLASKIFGVLKNRKGSKKKIRDFIEENKIAEEEFLEKVSEYKNFNEFFYRLKPEARPVNSVVIISGKYCIWKLELKSDDILWIRIT